MKHGINYCWYFINNVINCFVPRMLLLVFICSVSLSTQANDRFAAPNLNAASNTFNSRFTNNSFNTDFLLSHVLNNARQIERLGEDIKNDTKFVNEQVNTLDGAISNSVIVPPGVDANTIIVINITEGDSVAIQR